MSVCLLTSNAVYKIYNLANKSLKIADTKDLIQWKSNKSLKFVGFTVNNDMNDGILKENLEIINPYLPFVLERMIWNHFFEGETKVAIANTVHRIILENPLHISRPEHKYPYMMKSFLYAIYCGMTASELWDGKEKVNGEYITVNKGGENQTCYTMDSETFKEYLYQSCYVRFPSTSEKHGTHVKVYKVNDSHYLNLNFQVTIV